MERCDLPTERLPCTPGLSSYTVWEACGIVRSHGSVVKKRSRSRGVKIYTPAINLQKGSPTPDFLYHADTNTLCHGQYVQLTLTNQTLKKYDNIPHSAALQEEEWMHNSNVRIFSEKVAQDVGEEINSQFIHRIDGDIIICP